MKVILTQDVKNLGHKDDIVSVKDGYGRNFLIPQGKAKLASDGALKMLAEDIRQREFKMEKLRKDAEALAAKLNGITIQIAAKAGNSGKIFGSVTSLQVANALKDKGFDVDRRKIVFDDIKSVGQFEANINLVKDINASIILDVVAD
ncbi:MAG: 50S ribosomal protein L9 [Flavobacterium stagni]|jgi:large subunit ribosomal protein L9